MSNMFCLRQRQRENHRRRRAVLAPPVAATLLILIAGQANGAGRGGYVQFNADILDVKDRSHINLGQFSRAGYLMPGLYQLTVRINQAELPERSITFMPPDDAPQGSSPCLTQDLVSAIGLTARAMGQLRWWHKGACLDIKSLPGMQTRADLGSGTLYINVPRKWLEYTSDNWDPPSRWDDGVPGILADYDINALSMRSASDNATQSASGNGTVGVNAGPWRLRADWQAQYQHRAGRARQNWRWSRYYLFRAITSLSAKLVLGENYLDSTLFDSFLFTGASLASDDAQLPPNLRGYAPEVSGVAKTNAKVTVSQRGRVLYETTVAAGPFRIQDLNDAFTGTLDVRVEEQDGSVHTFQVETANIPYLTRPGTVRYKISSGKPSDYDRRSRGPLFTAGEFSWGINNGWSLYGGGLGAEGYTSEALGIGRDLLAFGAVSADVTYARASFPQGEIRQGSAWRLSYAKRFADYDSQITFAGYRFSERRYMTMPQFLSARYQHSADPGSSKQRYTLSFNKQFRALNLSTYITYSHQSYWDRPASDTWNVSLSDYFSAGNIKDVSLTLSGYRSQYEGKNDDGLYLSLTIPWGSGSTLSYSGQFGAGESQHDVRYFARPDSNNDYSLSAGTTSRGKSTASAWITHEGDIAEISANASTTGGRYSAIGFSLHGGLTATAQGAALHRTVSPGGSRMMVDTGGVSGVPVRGSAALTRSNMFGKAVISDISSYYRSSINIDLNRLPDNMEATRSVVQDTLTEGAIGYRRFGVLSGRKSMAVIRLADGGVPPFGAAIANRDGIQTGIVGDDGTVWLAGIVPDASMNVRWDETTKCRIRLPRILPPSPLRLVCRA